MGRYLYQMKYTLIREAMVMPILSDGMRTKTAFVVRLDNLSNIHT